MSANNQLIKSAVDALENIGGVFPTYRRAHAKGIIFSGLFIPNGKAKHYTRASHLVNHPVHTTIRFSNAAINPLKAKRSIFSVKGLAVQFKLDNGEIMNLTTSTIKAFFTNDPEKFVHTLQNLRRPNRNFLYKFKKIQENINWRTLINHLKYLKSAKSFALCDYHSIHTFFLENEERVKTPVKFSWKPVITEKRYVEKIIHGEFTEAEELLLRKRKFTIRFNLYITIGEQSDPIDDCSETWPEDRQEIKIGTLFVEELQEEIDDKLYFDPTAVPDGVVCPSDPILQFRKKVYEESFMRRTKENLKG